MVVSTSTVKHAAKAYRVFKPSYEKISSYVLRILLFLFYSYVKSHVDNDSCLPNYKTIPAICNTPPQTHCVQNSIFPHFVMVIRVILNGQAERGFARSMMVVGPPYK